MTGTQERDFLAIPDLSPPQLLSVMDRAVRMKSGQEVGTPLLGKGLALIFRKSSTRTRVSFEAGIHQLGGYAVVLTDRDSQMGRGESIHDTAKVLSGYVDGIMIRTFAHDEVEELARHATVPVINGLTDLLHPCQVLADLLTAREELEIELAQLRVAWIGDGNNMANSWLNAAAHLGFEISLACPTGYDPDPAILERAQDATRVTLTRAPLEAATGANVVTTDVWASMGQEEEASAREAAFQGFQVNEELMESADRDAIFLHCLPAHRGEEVTPGVIDGPQSRVFQEAENRLHVQKALMAELMG